jgi:hypothetical protein
LLIDFLHDIGVQFTPGQQIVGRTSAEDYRKHGGDSRTDSRRPPSERVLFGSERRREDVQIN